MKQVAGDRSEFLANLVDDWRNTNQVSHDLFTRVDQVALVPRSMPFPTEQCLYSPSVQEKKDIQLVAPTQIGRPTARQIILPRYNPDGTDLIVTAPHVDYWLKGSTQREFYLAVPIPKGMQVNDVIETLYRKFSPAQAKLLRG